MKALPVRERRCDVQMNIALFVVTIIICPVLTGIIALSYRDISEILRERCVDVHHSTVYRWVQEYAPILYQIWKRKHKKAYYKWRIDETYIKIKDSGVICIVQLMQMDIH